MTVSKYSDIPIVNTGNGELRQDITWLTTGNCFFNFNIINPISYGIIEMALYFQNYNNRIYRLIDSVQNNTLQFCAQNYYEGPTDLVSNTISTINGYSAMYSNYNLGVILNTDNNLYSVYINGTILHSITTINYSREIKNSILFSIIYYNSNWSSINTDVQINQNIFPNECPYGVPSGYKTLGELMSDGKTTKNNSEELYWYK